MKMRTALTHAINFVKRRQAAREIFGPRIIAARNEDATLATPPEGAVYRAPRPRGPVPSDVPFFPAFIPRPTDNGEGHHRRS